MNQVIIRTHKLYKIAFIVIVAILIIVMRLIYLQISLSDHFLVRGNKNFLRIETIHAPRGDIVDCHGRHLATNRPVIILYWNGTGNHTLTQEQLTILNTIGSILHTEIASQTIRTISRAEKLGHLSLIYRDITFEQLSTIEELFPNNANIHVKTDFERYYPYRTYACHILGYVSSSSTQAHAGIAGIEKLFQDLLKGHTGSIQKTINSVGSHLEQVQIVKEQPGLTIQTTIDIDLQDIAERAFPSSFAGTILLMNPESGDIRALVSRPGFDPSQFLRPISLYNWQYLQKGSPLLNRAFNAAYPPGSLFKLITVSAALEQNIVSIEDTFICKGYTHCGKRKYWCHRQYGHGQLTTQESVAQSCNILFFEVAQKIDIDILADYACKFGLGRKTHIPFQEKLGLIPTKAWKQQTLHESFWPGEKLSLAIGQSFLLVTPIQIARMISSIFTGYLPVPRIITSEPLRKENLDIHPATLSFLRKSMKTTVRKGTGRKARITDMKIYAKTSTAQTSSLDKRKMGSEYLEHGWFAGYFKYKDNPPYALIIQLEHAGSAQVAAGIAKEFLTEYKRSVDRNIIKAV